MRDHELDKLFPHYDPRPFGVNPPASGAKDAPFVCLYVNREWVPHLVGVLDRLAYVDAWTTAEDESSHAIQAVLEIQSALANGNGQMVTDVRCLLGELQVKYCDSDEWVTVCSFPDSQTWGVTESDCKLYQNGGLIVDLKECAAENVDNPPVGESEVEDEIAVTEDELCGAVTKIVEEMLEIANDALDIVEAVLTAIDALIDIIDNVLGWDPPGWIDEMLQVVAEVGSAGIAFVRQQINDGGFEEELRCEMYTAMWCQNAGVFEAELVRSSVFRSFTLPPEDPIGETFARYMIHGIKDRRLFTYWKMGKRDPNELCIDCGPCPTPWESTWLFDDILLEQEWTRRFGTFVTDGLADEYVASVGARLARLTVEFDNVEVEDISFTYDLTEGNSDEGLTSGVRAYLLGYGGSVEFDDRGSIPQGSELTQTYNIGQYIDAIEVTLNPMNRVSGDGGGSALLRSITVTGWGTKPLGWP